MDLDRCRRCAGCRRCGGFCLHRYREIAGQFLNPNIHGAWAMTLRSALSLILAFAMATPPARGDEKRPVVAVVDAKVPEESLGDEAAIRAAFWKAFADSGKVRMVGREPIDAWRERR